jgi:hypothetical protein
MDILPKMIDMARTPAQIADDGDTGPSAPIYPYGLCICLCDEELAKLGLSTDDVEIGDMLHIHGLAKVTSVSTNDTENGSSTRIELTLAYLSAPVENEDEENAENERATAPQDRRARLYKKG